MPDDRDERLECLIVGAGPAGLVAATYLARFRRRIAVVDAGASRARWIPTSHNCPGFPLGVSGERLLERLRAQAAAFGVEVESGRIERLEREGDGFLARADDGRAWRARCVILATGIVDRMPGTGGDVAPWEAAIDAGTLRICAVCDAFEASDERIAVYAPTDEAIRHAVFLRTFSRRVDAVRSDAVEATADCAALARAAGIAVLPAPTALACTRDGCTMTFADGGTRAYDVVYPVLGDVPQSQLATALGARGDAGGELLTDRQQQTSVDGLYAVGDVVSALNQIAVAVGHAAIAATAVHNRLPRNFREDDAAPSPPAGAGALPPAR
ncbi:MAG TPA: NAD(P)/FAD-dependent oxidoreductase [Xanthomonadaceae bacterium]|nr:NAD(P)/FAD-dependent oxidoreductase [Xanthomonadaceae bacterium]